MEATFTVSLKLLKPLLDFHSFIETAEAASAVSLKLLKPL
jgi:hypothetical protein